MTRRYGSFTPARRVALRKAQLASARKRRGRGRKVATGVAVGVAVIGAAGVAGYSHQKKLNKNYITLYHHTRSPVRSIKKHGLKDIYGDSSDTVFLSNKRNRAVRSFVPYKTQGKKNKLGHRKVTKNHAVKVYIPRQHARNLKYDRNHPRVMTGGEKFYGINRKHLAGAKYSSGPITRHTKSKLHGNRTSSKVKNVWANH